MWFVPERLILLLRGESLSFSAGERNFGSKGQNSPGQIISNKCPSVCFRLKGYETGLRRRHSNKTSASSGSNSRFLGDKIV